MGKRGPQKTPTVVLEKRGSWLAKTRKDEPPTTGKPEKPKWLSKGAADHWDKIILRLENLGIVGECDSDKLALYCSYNDILTNQLKAKNPDHKIIKIYAPLVDRLGSQFGLSPSARASMAISKPKETNVKSKFFRPA